MNQIRQQKFLSLMHKGIVQLTQQYLFNAKFSNLQKSHMKRIGLLIPSSNTTMEPDFHEFLPNTTQFFTTRMPLRDVTEEALIKMDENSPEHASLLADVKPEVIIYGCTSGSFIEGKGYDQKLEKKIYDKTKVPTITTSHAVIDCLKKINLYPVLLLSPYTQKINEKEMKFFMDNNIEMLKEKGMGIVDNLVIGRLMLDNIYKFILENDDPRAKCIFVSCTNLAVLSVLLKIRQKLNKPIISSNLASLWGALQIIKENPMHNVYKDLINAKK